MRQRAYEGRDRLWGGLSCLLLLGAIAARTDVWPLGLLGGAGILGLALANRQINRGTRAGLLGLNLTLLVLYVWAASERSLLTVQITPSEVVASLGSVRLDAPRGREIDNVTIALASADERSLTTPWSSRSLSWLEPAANWLTENLRAGLADAEVRDAEGAMIARQTGRLWQASRAQQAPTIDSKLEGWSSPEAGEHGEVLVTAVPSGSAWTLSVWLLRASSTVRVLLSEGPRGAEHVVVVAPDRRTLVIESGQSERLETAAGGLFAYKRDAASWCQALTREWGRSWLYALLLLASSQLLARSYPGKVTGPRRWLPSIPCLTVCASLSALTLGVTSVIARWILEGIPHVQDSVTYLFQAQLFAAGRLAAPAPALPEFFEQEFVLVHGGQWFGKYSPGQPLLLSLGVLIGAPWIISPLTASGAIAMTYLAARRLYGPRVALLAATLLLTSPFVLLMSGTMMSHPAGLLWTSALLLAVVFCRQEGGPLAWCVAGFATAMLLITRQLTAVAIATILLAPLMYEVAVQPRTRIRFSALTMIGAAPPTFFLLYFNWRLLGSPFASPYELWWSFDRVGFGPSVGMHGGHDLAGGLANTWANSTALLRHLFGWPPYLTLAPALVPFVTLRRNEWDWLLGSVVVSVVAVHVAYWADGIMYGPRYYYEAAGVLAILTARGMALMARPLTECPGAAPEYAQGHVRPGNAFGPAAALFALGVATNLLGYLPATLWAHRGYNGVSRARLELVEQSQIGRALVFVTQRPPEWQPYGSVFPANGPLLDGPVIFARDLGDAENGRLRELHTDRPAYVLRDMQLTPVP